ncbi:MAG: ABC transporter substrate-binding protein [Pseudobutyrivibrio sp.]|nr:ABC transporter substrate-binding protein [Pseudobutyrivibrio sp.]
MKKKLFSLMLVASMTATLFAGCGSAESATEGAATTEADATTEAVEGSWKIGGIGPMTGAAAVYGNAVMNAAQIAADEINAAGGINGYQVAFNAQDDEHDQQKSVNAYNTLKDWGAHAILGTVTTAPCIAVAAEANNDRVFMLTPSASSPDVNVTNGYDNVYQVCFSDPNQGTASADYIADNAIGTKVGIIYNSSDAYSTGIMTTFVAEATAKGLDFVDPEAFTSDSNQDFSTQLTKLQSEGCDVIFLPTYYQENSLILNQANSMGYAPIFFGVDGMDGILSLEGFDTSLAEGVYLLTPFAADAQDELTKNFVAKYQEKYGETPNQFAADAYDAMYIYKAALEDANLTPDASAAEVCEALVGNMSTLSVDGLTGTAMKWSTDGTVSKAPKAVIIKDGVYVSAE